MLFLPWFLYFLSQFRTWSDSTPFDFKLFVQFYATLLAVGAPSNIDQWLWPVLLIWALLLVGILVGVTRWALTGFPHTEVLLLNTFWALYNLMLVGAAISVAREARQLRSSVRHDLVLPAVVHLPNGRTIATQSRNISTTGGQCWATSARRL